MDFTRRLSLSDDPVSWIKETHPFDACSIEGQIANWVDDVAYSVDDFEDSFLAGLLDFREMARRASEIEAEITASGSVGYSSREIEMLATRLYEDLVESPSGERHRRRALKDWTSRTIHSNLLSGCAFMLRSSTTEGSSRYDYTLRIPEDNLRFADTLKAVARVLVFRSSPIEALEFKGTGLIRRLFKELTARWDQARLSPIGCCPPTLGSAWTRLAAIHIFKFESFATSLPA